MSIINCKFAYLKNVMGGYYGRRKEFCLIRLDIHTDEMQIECIRL